MRLHVFFVGFLLSAPRMSQRTVCGSVLLRFVCVLLDMFSQQECLHECSPWCSLLMKLRMAWNLMNPWVFHLFFFCLFLVKVFSLLRSTPQQFQFSGKYLTTAKPHTERLVRQVWLKLPCNVCSLVLINKKHSQCHKYRVSCRLYLSSNTPAII